MDSETDTVPSHSACQEFSVSDGLDNKDSRAEVESEKLAQGRMFEDVDTRLILGQVPSKLQGEAARSLWRRIDSELASGGPRAVTSYLRSRFEGIGTRLRTELSAATDVE